MNSELPPAPKGHVALTDVLHIAAVRIVEHYPDFPQLTWFHNHKLWRFFEGVPTTDTIYNGVLEHLLAELQSLAAAEKVKVFFWDELTNRIESVAQTDLVGALQFIEVPPSEDGYRPSLELCSWRGQPLIWPRDLAFIAQTDTLIGQLTGIKPPERKKRDAGRLSGEDWELIAPELPFWPLDFALIVMVTDASVELAVSKYAAWLDYGGRKFTRLAGDRSYNGYIPFVERWARMGLIPIYGVRGGGSVSPEQPREITAIEWMDLSIHFVSGLGYVARRIGGSPKDVFWYDLHVDREVLTSIFGSLPEEDKPKGRPALAKQRAEMALKDLYPPDGKRPQGTSQIAATAAVNDWLKQRGQHVVSQETVLRALGDRKG